MNCSAAKQLPQGLRSASVGAEQTSPGRLAPPAGRKGTFDGRYGCRKCFCVTFDKSNKTAVSGESFLNIAMSGVNKNYVSYLALKQKRGEKIYDEKNNQWHDRSRFTGS